MPTREQAPRVIAVPGSISNLGPGFDALSVAADVYLRLSIVDIQPEAPGLLHMDFDTAAPPGENRIASGFLRARDWFGERASGVRVRVESDIPMRAGLGSSAAATVAGLKLYEAVTRARPIDDLLMIATEIEGHPDNAAAALLGGLTLSCQQPDGRIRAVSRRWPADLKFVVGTPEAQLETAFARTVVPRELPLEDAVFNLQRALLLLHALDTGRYDLLREAMQDRWHQSARAAYVPGLSEVLALDHPAILGACLSGAGPSIALLVTGAATEAAAQLAGIYTRLAVPYTIRTLTSPSPMASPGTDS